MAWPSLWVQDIDLRKRYSRILAPCSMVNNAGVAMEATYNYPIYEMPEEVFDKTIQINAKGVWLGCKYAGQQMIKQDMLPGSTSRGWIINISSVLGLTGKAGTSCYSTSKGGVIGMTRAAAMDFAPHNIHCNVICPGCECSSGYLQVLSSYAWSHRC